MGYTLPFSFAQQRTKPNMNPLILLTACVAASQAQIIAAPYGLGAPLTYGAAPIAYQTAAAPAPVVTVNAAPAPVPVAAPVAPSSQFHAGDEFGNIQYGYANINSQKHEVGNTYGGVSGTYSYVDANGVVQTTNYIADGLGFRVQATNLPVAPAAPEVELPVAPVHEYELPVAPVHEYTLPVAPVHEYELPVGPESVVDTPEVAAAKAEHLALLAAAAAPAEEARSADVAPEELAEVAPVAEVAEEVAEERRRRSTPADTEVLEVKPIEIPAPIVAPVAYAHPGLAHPYAAGVAHPYVHGGLAHPYAHAGLAYPYAAPAAVVASAPAAREATLTTVKLNPGHAVAYRVD